MASFGKPYEQIQAKESIMFSACGTYYKIPIQKQDSASLKSLVSLSLVNSQLPHLIRLCKEPKIGG